MSKPRIALQLRTSQLSMPVTQFIWTMWLVLTYPLSLGAGYYFFGWDGVFFVTILTVLNFRGKL